MLTKFSLRNVGRRFQRIRKAVVSWSWNWANIIAFLSAMLTFGALLFSIEQNQVGEKRYHISDSTNNIESARINRRDSIQTNAQTTQTEILINEFKEQKLENSRSRLKDSSQLALLSSQLKLLNKSILAQTRELDIQNQILQVQRLANKSELQCDISFELARVRGNYVSTAPLFSVVNIGKSSAINLVVKYNFITVDNVTRSTDCQQTQDIGFYRSALFPDQQKKLQPFIVYGIPFDLSIGRKKALQKVQDQTLENLKKLQSNDQQLTQEQINIIGKTLMTRIDSLQKVSPREPYTNYLIAKLSYQDKYQKEINAIYFLHKMSLESPLVENTKVVLSIEPVNLNELPLLKKCIIENKYNYNKIVELVRQQISESGNTSY